VVHKGNEFYNKEVQKLITFYSTENEEKSGVAETWDRTTKENMFMYFSFLDEIVEEYNSTKHFSIGMTPKEANQKKTKLKSGEICTVITFHPSVRHVCFLIFFTFNPTNNFYRPNLPIHRATYMALRFVLRPFTLGFKLCVLVYRCLYGLGPEYFRRTSDFYGSAICIKAVYSRDPHCKDFLSQKCISSKVLIAFDLIVQIGKPYKHGVGVFFVCCLLEPL